MMKFGENNLQFVAIEACRLTIERVKELPQNKEVEVYYDDFTRTHYFRITEEQYNQLTKDYMESKKESEESIKKVTFSCEELFGDFLELESN